MIDIEPEVFNTVYEALIAEYPDITVSSGYVPAQATFPAVTLMEMANSPVVETQSSSCYENHSRLMYEANVYTADKVGRKSVARDIAESIDKVMNRLGFYRTTMTPIPNEDPTIYRMVLRYVGVVSKEHVIYRR